MKIEKLNGTDKRMYQLIAPFSMNRAVIRQNGRIPITTSERHIWYVAVIGRKAVAFLSLVGETIKNDYYTDIETFEQLIAALMSDYKDSVLKYVASNDEIPVMKKMGFIIEKTSVNYAYMKYERKETV